jgi:hypothetical protein
MLTGSTSVTGALAPGGPPAETPVLSIVSGDDEIVDAELVEAVVQDRALRGSAEHALMVTSRMLTCDESEFEEALVRLLSRDVNVTSLDRLDDSALRAMIRTCDSLRDGRIRYLGVGVDGLPLLEKLS